jgi:hypothetical protein
MLFGQFVGVWNMQVEFFNDHGDCVYSQPGQWSFAWVLDGRAIQDVLTYPRPGEADRGIGTSLRSTTRDPGDSRLSGSAWSPTSLPAASLGQGSNQQARAQPGTCACRARNQPPVLGGPSIPATRRVSVCWLVRTPHCLGRGL